jgi:hypothetical protein
MYCFIRARQEFCRSYTKKDSTMFVSRALEVLLVGAVIVGFGIASAGIIV